MKLSSACCMGIGLIIVSTFASFYMKLLNHSSSYNAAMIEATEAKVAAGETVAYTLQYDDCGNEPSDSTLDLKTSWSLVYQLNTIFYALLTGMIVCSCVGLVYYKVFNVTLHCL